MLICRQKGQVRTICRKGERHNDSGAKVPITVVFIEGFAVPEKC